MVDKVDKIEFSEDEFFVYIIESPNNDNFFDKVFEGESLSSSLKLMDIESIHRFIISRENLEYALKEEVINLAIDKKLRPIIHISAHGDHEGIQLTDNDEVYWNDLADLLKPLSSLLEGKFILCMSSCKGFSAFEMALTLDKQLPFFNIVGNTQDVNWDDALVGFTSFYHILKKTMDFSKGIEALKVSSGNKNFDAVSANIVKELYENSTKEHLRKKGLPEEGVEVIFNLMKKQVNEKG